MLVKLQRRVNDSSNPLDEYIFECQDVHLRYTWLTHADQRFEVHNDPDALWSPFTMIRGYEYPLSVSAPHMEHEADQSFKPHGVLLLTLEGPNRHKEIWIENGIAWIMNNQGKTVAKAQAPFQENYQNE